MNPKTNTPDATEFPLAGGDYIDNGKGLKQVAESTAPMPGKSDQPVPAPAKKTAAAGKPDPAAAA